jgi:hypothetical protein
LFLGPLDEDAVRDCLPVGISPSASAFEALRTPQWLNLYLRTHKLGGTMMSTLQAFWNDTFLNESKLEETALALAQEMSKREELWLSYEVANGVANASDIQKLLHFGILTQRKKIGFSHQTIFEFAELRTFLKEDVSLLAYVRGKEFALATRSTVRSALTYLREADAKKYETELTELLNAADLRLHLRLMIVAWLGSQRGLKAFEKVEMKKLWKNEKGTWITYSVRNNVEWFDVLEAFLPELMLDPTGRNRDRALALLEGALLIRTDRVIRLANQHWLDVPTAARHLGHLVSSGTGWVDDLSALAASAIRMLVGDDDKAYPFASVSSLISSVLKRSATAAVSLCAEYCDALLKYEPKDDDARKSRDIARAYFENPSELWFLDDLARAAPEEFMQQVWPRLVSMLERVSEERGYEYNASLSIATAYPPAPGDRDGWMIAVREAAEMSTKRDPAFLRNFAMSAKSSVCETVHAVIIDLLRKNLATSGQLAVDYLLEDDRRFSVSRGSYHDEPSLSEELLMDLKPNLTEEQRQLLAGKIQRLSWARAGSWTNLKPELRLSLSKRDARTRDDLARALDRGRPKASKATSTRSRGLQLVRSGMSAAQMLVATDEDVLTFLAPLEDKTEWNHPNKWLTGGSIEASRELAEASKTDPQRFLALIRKLHVKHQRPVAYVLDALTDRLSMSEFEEHFHFFLEEGFFAPTEHVSGMAWAIDKMVRRGLVPTERTLEVLKGWLTSAAEMQQTETTSGERQRQSLLFGYGSFSLLPEGNYPILRALGHALRQLGTSEAKERWFCVLEEHVHRGERSTVWRALLNGGVLFPLGERREKLTDTLFARFPDVRDSREGIALILRSRAQVTDTAIRRWCAQVGSGSWNQAGQGFGEMLLILACDKVDWATEQLRERLASASPKDDEVRDGIAFAAPHLFDQNRELVTDTMLKLIDRVSDQALDAMGLVFYQATFSDRHIERLLAAIEPRWVLHLDLGRMTELVELLKQRDEDQAATVLWQLVNGASKRERLSWIDREFVELTLTFQRADSQTAREHGLNAFEKLQEVGALGVAEALDSLDSETRHFDSA